MGNDMRSWVGIVDAALSYDDVHEWLSDPQLGATVVFSGIARDHSAGRDEVSKLEYETYDEQAAKRLTAVADELGKRFPTVQRFVCLHRTGVLEIGDVAVIVGVGAPHRMECFNAASFGIDAVKATLPMWKKETWRDGSDWGIDGADLRSARDMPQLLRSEQARTRVGRAGVDGTGVERVDVERGPDE